MKSPDPLISILLPVYNDEKRIGSSLERLCEQSYSQKQIIVYNDGSTDNSLNIALEYQSKYSFIEIFSSPKNCGVVKALKSAYQHSRGEYVYSGSSNDFVRPGFLERAATLLNKYPEAGFYAGNVNAISENGSSIMTCSRTLNRIFISKNEVVLSAARGGLQFFGQAVVFRKSAYNELCVLHDELRWVSDLFCYFILAHTHGFVLSHEIDSDMDVRGGFSSLGHNRSEQKKVLLSMLELLSSSRYCSVRKNLQKSGILAHFGPRLTIELCKRPSDYGYFSKNYFLNLLQLVFNKVC